MVSNSSKKLLVADDSLTIQKVIRLALANEGYEIQAVSDGKDAIQQISLFRPDVILVDVSMPNRSAFEIKRELNAHPDFASMRVVLMSSAFERVDEDQAKDLVFHARLIKPFDPAHLRKTLTEVLVTVGPESSVVSAAPPPPPPPSPPAPPLADLAPLQPPALEPILMETPADQPTAPGATGDEFQLAVHATPPEPPPVEEYGDSPESDIKNLTASTIKMSGLGEMDWSVQENAAKNPAEIAHARLPGIEPTFQSTPPPPPEDSTRALDLSELTGVERSTPSIESSALPPMPPLDVPEWTTSPPTEEPTSAGIELPSDFLTQSEPMVPQPEISMPPTGAAAAALAASSSEAGTGASYSGAGFSTPTIDAAMVETIVKNQLEEILQRLTSKALPDIAERVIKEEIHKLLSQAP